MFQKSDRPPKPAADVQNEHDGRRISIDKVGVKDIEYPIQVLDRAQKVQQTVARVSMYVNLPHQFKGTHMSRFVELLNEHSQDMSTLAIAGILRAMCERLQAETAHLELSFPLFVLKRAPVSGAEGLMSYRCSVRGTGGKDGDVLLESEVQVPITALCPCSKAISDEGAHNQRGLVTVRFHQRRFVWIEEVIDIVERSASCEVYSVLKREDEKYVTEKAYANPMFVEDVARSVAEKLCAHDLIDWFSVEVENQESIHAHNAYACLERGQCPDRGA
ncbi:MAG: GTP cyclohydrolase I FolE2 [Deltaproteobacteria bacterium]|nr:GTP cyclohydrolase I FolE2 [Deltaproteobacteria bacterium]